MLALLAATRPFDVRQDEFFGYWLLDSIGTDEKYSSDRQAEALEFAPLPEWSIYDHLAGCWN